MYGWMRANRLGNLDLGTGSQTLQSAMMLNEELIQLRQQAKEQEKEIRRLKKENNFWEEDECNDTYGRSRMYQALNLRRPEHVEIPSERTICRVMEEIGISHHPRRKPNGITKSDRGARKSDDLLKRDFHAEGPLTKCITDITEIKGKDGKLYVSAIFDCFGCDENGMRFYVPMVARCLLTKKMQIPKFNSNDAKKETSLIISFLKQNPAEIENAFMESVKIINRSLTIHLQNTRS